MTWAKRAFLLAGSVAALAAALLVLFTVGLPERAAFTGQVIPGQLPIAPEINAVAPPFELINLEGDITRLADLRGQHILINFWATWCIPCRVEMPVLQRLYEQHQADGLYILAVNLGEPSALAREWQRSLGLTYAILLDKNQSTAALYQLRGQPSTYVISPNGIITHIFYGPASENALRAALHLQP